jgi:hypothetical protein
MSSSESALLLSVSGEAGGMMRTYPVWKKHPSVAVRHSNRIAGLFEIERRGEGFNARNRSCVFWDGRGVAWGRVTPLRVPGLPTL